MHRLVHLAPAPCLGPYGGGAGGTFVVAEGTSFFVAEEA